MGNLEESVTLTFTDNLDSQILYTCMPLASERKPTQTCGDDMPTPHRKDQRKESNPVPFGCEAVVLTTQPPLTLFTASVKLI